MTVKNKAKAIITIESLRLIESELFTLMAKHGIKTIDELDDNVADGKISELMLGDDLFRFDYLLTEKEKYLKELKKLAIKKTQVWKSLQNLLGLPKQSFQTS